MGARLASVLAEPLSVRLVSARGRLVSAWSG